MVLARPDVVVRAEHSRRSAPACKTSVRDALHKKRRDSGRGLPSDRAFGWMRRASYFNGVSTRTADQIGSYAQRRIWAAEP